MKRATRRDEKRKRRENGNDRRKKVGGGEEEKRKEEGKKRRRARERRRGSAKDKRAEGQGRARERLQRLWLERGAAPRQSGRSVSVTLDSSIGYSPFYPIVGI